MKFWLDLGVAGFRIDAVPHFFEDERFLDEELVPGTTPGSYESVTRKFTYNLQPDVNELLAEFRAVADEYSNKDDGLQRQVFIALCCYTIHENICCCLLKMIVC